MLLCRRGSSSSCAKQRASLRASAGSAAAKKACASGERMTSNIRPHLAPTDSLPGRDRLLGGGQPLAQCRAVEELNVLGQRRQALGRQAIDLLLDLSTQFDRAHDGMICDVPARVEARAALAGRFPQKYKRSRAFLVL